MTVLLGLREDSGTWDDRDRIMALALQSYEDSLHSCGVSSFVAFGEKNMERVEWKESICFACESLEAKRNDKTSNDYPGKILLPKWEDIPGEV